MTREEIGSHLGLTLETVSRLFSRFHERGLIEVKGRTIKIVDRSTLRRLVDRNGEPAAGETQQRRAASIGRAA
jgi:CRP/FNR family transcriptional regulator